MYGSISQRCVSRLVQKTREKASTCLRSKHRRSKVSRWLVEGFFEQLGSEATLIWLGMGVMLPEKLACVPTPLRNRCYGRETLSHLCISKNATAEKLE